MINAKVVKPNHRITTEEAILTMTRGQIQQMRLNLLEEEYTPESAGKMRMLQAMLHKLDVGY